MRTDVNTTVDEKDLEISVTVKQTFTWADINWVIERMGDVLLPNGKITPSEIVFTNDQKLEILKNLEDELDAADLTIRTDDPIYSDDQWSNADEKIKDAVFDYVWQWADELWPDLITFE